VTTEQAFIRSTLLILATEKSLDILCQLSQNQRNQKLPSWVPDYADRTSLTPYTKNIGLYDASNERPLAFECISDRFLLMRGKIVGIINEVATGMFYHTKDSKDAILKEWFTFAAEHNKTVDHDQAITWEQIFWRTVSGEWRSMAEDHGLMRLSGVHFRSMLETASPDFWDVEHVPARFSTQSIRPVATPSLPLLQMNNDDFGSMARKINETTLGRKFFITESAAMGVGPFFTGLQHIRKKEIVVVFPGGRTPFVLREIGEIGIEGVGK
jgi:hypothetical protein